VIALHDMVCRNDRVLHQVVGSGCAKPEHRQPLTAWTMPCAISLRR
jgi:hypothetical protein